MTIDRISHIAIKSGPVSKPEVPMTRLTAAPLSQWQRRPGPDTR